MSALWLFLSVLPKLSYACNVIDVDLHVGTTADVACDDDLTTAYVGIPFHACIEWTANLPDNNPFACQFEYKVTGSAWQLFGPEYECVATARHAHIEISASDYGEKKFV